jgi:hypothetical protein
VHQDEVEVAPGSQVTAAEAAHGHQGQAVGGSIGTGSPSSSPSERAAPFGTDVSSLGPLAEHGPIEDVR